MYGHALWELSKQPEYESLVPFAGRDETYSSMHFQYMPSFSRSFAATLDVDGSATVSPRETWVGYDTGVWSFDSLEIRAFYECLIEIARLFPPGFLGLDREQSRRRFVNGNAGFTTSGLWDAQSLFGGAEGRLLRDAEPDPPGETVTVVNGERRAGYRFNLEVMEYPLPGPDERWAEFELLPQSGASNGGGMFMVYTYSPNKDFAVDFLRYLGSVGVNERFNQQAGLAPAIVGAEARGIVRSFQADPRGISSLIGITPQRGPTGLIGVRYTGQLKNLLTGDISYEQFVADVQDAFDDPLNGMDRLWWRVDQQDRDRARISDATYAAVVAESVLLDEEPNAARTASAFRRTALKFSGIEAERLHRQLKPGEPFPKYE
ncbi:MAG: hypothetical protein AAF561_00320 [Planctomycetota bacterium]